MTQPISIPPNITLTTDQYTSLVALARRGTQDQVPLEAFLISIEKANGITRYLLWVRWQELDSPLPPTTRFPTHWPPELQRLIQQINQPVSLAQVNQVLATYAKNPTNVMVTPDPNALLGWSTLAQYFPGETD
jgi:hypothetical protein